MTRYEVKFVCEEPAHARVLAELHLLPQALRRQHGARVVQSIYYDTPGRAALEDNLAGVADRQKLRFRWYGEETRTVRGQLELKRRRGDVGDKLTCPIDVPVAVEGSPRTAFARAVWTASPPEWRERLHGHEPVLWTRYVREYFVTAGGAVRVTVDRGLLAFELRLDPVLSCRRALPLPRILIVEVKADAAHATELTELVQALPLLRSKCSKFAWASAPDEAPPVSRLLG